MSATSALSEPGLGSGVPAGWVDPDQALWAALSTRATRAIPLPVGTANKQVYTGRGILMGYSVLGGGTTNAPAAEVIDGWDSTGSILAEIVVPIISFPYIYNDTHVDASSAGGAQANNVTLAGVANQTTYISGFEITGDGATAGSIITITVTGILGGTKTYYLTVPAGVGVATTQMFVEYTIPIPASAVNTAIVVNVPSFGAGNTNAAVTAHGFQRSTVTSGGTLTPAATVGLPGNGSLFRNGLYLRTIRDTFSGALYVKI